MRTETLGSILLESKIIGDEQLAEAVRRQTVSGLPLGEILTEMGYASTEDVARALAKQFSIPYFVITVLFVPFLQITWTRKFDFFRAFNFISAVGTSGAGSYFEFTLWCSLLDYGSFDMLLAKVGA